MSFVAACGERALCDSEQGSRLAPGSEPSEPIRLRVQSLLSSANANEYGQDTEVVSYGPSGTHLSVSNTSPERLVFRGIAEPTRGESPT